MGKWFNQHYKAQKMGGVSVLDNPGRQQRCQGGRKKTRREKHRKA
jgi:hypothetical protein